MTEAPESTPFDPCMDLPGVPDDWRVFWCPGCGYAVTWDATAEDDDWGLWYRIVQEAARHDCPLRTTGRDVPRRTTMAHSLEIPTTSDPTVTSDPASAKSDSGAAGAAS